MQDSCSFLASSSDNNSTNGHTNGSNGINGTNGPNGHANSLSRRNSDAAHLLRSRVFILSGKDERATRAMADDLKQYLLASKNAEETSLLDDLAYTLGHRRSLFPWILTFAATSIAGLVKTIESGKLKPVKKGDSPRLGFVYTGQGAQWWAMGRELIDVYPVFKAALLDCNVELKKLGATWNMIGSLTSLSYV